MSKPRTVNDNLELVTIDDIVNHKLISDEELNKDLANLNKYDCQENENNFAGNRFLYHYQFANLLHCTRERSGKPRETIYEMWADPAKKAFLIDQTRKRNRGGKVPANNIFECYRINTGSIVMFKSITAKYLYKKYRATAVLDPTAGWGGRMLGAWSLGIDYVGIDTNDEMKPAYDGMMDFLMNKTNSFGNGIGYNLGFLTQSVTSQIQSVPPNTVDPTLGLLKQAIIANTFPDTVQDTYVYLKLSDWDLITHQNPNQTSFTAFMKIPLTVPKFTTQFDNNSLNTTSKKYFFHQPTNVNLIQISLLDAYGNVIDLKYSTFSVTIQLQEVISNATYEQLLGFYE
jgi:hypothetical protein